MATISTSIELYDRVSAPIYKMLGALDDLNYGFESVEASINDVEHELDNGTQSQERFNQEIQHGASEMDGLTDKVMGLVGAYISLQGVQKLINLSDEYIQTDARLNMINDGLQTTDELQDKIFASAQRSRASYSAMADAVAKLSLNAGDAFGSNDETILFAENLNKLFAIAGTEQAAISSATLQLTQALGSGVLRGEEFNAVFEAAPNIMQTVADYMDIPIGKLRGMAAEGQITADIVKNALLASTSEINQQFENMPMTWAQVWTGVMNQLYMASQPVLELISLLAQNWSTLEPIVIGLAVAVGLYAAALITYNAVKGISNLLEAVGAARSAMSAGATFAQAVATKTATGAQVGFNAALLACPLTWIVLAIIAVVAAIAIWVRKIGGLKVAWLIVVNALLTAWDWVKIGFFTGVYWVIDLWNKMQLGLKTACVAIANFMTDMKVSVLLILENMVNGAIDIINGFIKTLNKLPGVSISTIDEVTFGTNAAIAAEAEKQARNQGLADYKAEIEAGIAEREAKLNTMQAEALAATASRQAEIDTAKAEASKEEADPFADVATEIEQTAENAALTAENTDAMKDSMDITSEELKYLRDIAEKEVVNRFTTAEIRVEMNNNNNISSNMDLDGVVDYLVSGVNEAMEKAAEGVHE